MNENKNKIYVISSWDDVTELDLKLCELLEYYKIKGSFYPVCNWIDKKILNNDIIQISEKHEIGSHTLNHVDLRNVPIGVAKKEIIDSKIFLEKILDKEVTSFVYPNGSYTESHVRIVEDAGYLCARTTKPFFVKGPENPYETNVTIWTYPHAYLDILANFRLLKINPKFLTSPNIIKDWEALGKYLFNYILKNGGVFHFYGHAWQIDLKNYWEALEKLLSFVAFRDNVNYVTLSEYFELIFTRA